MLHTSYRHGTTFRQRVLQVSEPEATPLQPEGTLGSKAKQHVAVGQK